MDAVRLGLQIRALRRQRRWTQRELARRVGISDSQVSRIERGAASRISLASLERLLAELGARVQVRVLWRGEELDRILDRDHATIVERLLEPLGRHGWIAIPEVTFQTGRERGSIDILAWHAATRILLVIEVKSVVPDIQATVSGLDRKARLGPAIARERAWSPAAVARLLVLPDDRTSRRRVDAFASTFASALPARTAAINRWLRRPVGPLAGILFLSNLPRVQPRQRIRAA
jgi:transcriptional regulator with XRE-family HTH domain